MKWNCPGVKEEIEKIKEFLNTSRRADKSFIAYKALKTLDNTISSLMSDEDNDINYLLTYRRQVRILLRTITQ